MEEESLFSSLSDIRDSVRQQHQQESRTSIDHQHINGEEVTVWGEMEVQMNHTCETEQLNHLPKGGQWSPEEAEQQWEQIWPVYPVTCTVAPFSCATVQWNMPEPFSEVLEPLTGRSLANELDSGRVTSLDTTPLPLHQSEDTDAELFLQEDTEEQDELNLLLSLSSEPCDIADVQDQTRQEKDDPTQELLDSISEIQLRTDSEEEEEEEEFVSEDAIETPPSTEETEGSEDGVDWQNAEELKQEEEQETSSFVLIGQEDSEEERDPASGVEVEENEEKGELDEAQTVTHISSNEEDEETKPTGFSCLSHVEFPQEPLQSGNTGLAISLELIHLQHSEHSKESRHSANKTGTEEGVELQEVLHDEPTGQTEEPEMCKDVAHNVDPEHSEATQQPDDNEEPAVEEAENAKRTDAFQEIEGEAEQLEHADCLEQQSGQIKDCEQMTPQDREPSTQPPHSEQIEMTEEYEQIQLPHQTEVQQLEDQSDLLQHLNQSPLMEPAKWSEQPENPDQPVQSALSEQTVCVEAEEQEPVEENGQAKETSGLSPKPSALSAQLEQAEQTQGLKGREQLFPESEGSQLTEETVSYESEDSHCSKDGSIQTVIANGEQCKPSETAESHMNGSGLDREKACRLAERLHKLDGIQRVDVVKHLDKDNDFSRAVGEEYLKFFDFSGQSLDHALRSFLKVVVLIGETQERERVLQHFSGRFHECNPDSFSSAGSVLSLTCALMLLNTDLHGQNVGKAMSSSKFVSNLEGMNEGENFSKDLLKSFYNAIKSEPLEWAVDEEELKNSVFLDDDSKKDAPLRSKSNPFQDVPHDTKAIVVKQGFLQRKVHADIDGKRTPWGKRSWKTFCGVLRGMVLYLQKDDCRREQHGNEEVLSVHHSLAEPAADYTKKPHVFRLQTADWRVFLFQASSRVEMNLWINRINLVSALHSSPPFPAAVGSQRRFCRPILPVSQSTHTLERQLQSHAGMLESFKADLTYLQQSLPEGRRAKAKELEEHRVRAEYLQHEVCRYEVYIQVLEAWKNVKKDDAVLNTTELNLFDKAMCADSVEEQGEEEGGLKRSYSSPSLELDVAPPTVIKVRRNISERRTYRRTIVPQWNKNI
ncbi:hypothetical protein LDENG_00221890 [Lucifuga dentata]|nr:hypothetical protein LDENG_00221890 [Lucifuga dentata]